MFEFWRCVVHKQLYQHWYLFRYNCDFLSRILQHNACSVQSASKTKPMWPRHSIAQTCQSTQSKLGSDYVGTREMAAHRQLPPSILDWMRICTSLSQPPTAHDYGFLCRFRTGFSSSTFSIIPLTILINVLGAPLHGTCWRFLARAI